MANGVVTMGANRAAVRAAHVQARGASRTIAFLLVPVGLLLVVGLGSILSASSVLGLREAGDGLFYFKRQIIWIALGLGAFLIAVRVPYRWYARMAAGLLLVAIAGLVATLFVGSVRGGARRWIDVELVTDPIVGALVGEIGHRHGTVRTYGELVTAVINPSHHLAGEYRRAVGSSDAKSPMRDHNGTMTVQELIDLVAFLQSTYSEFLPNDYDPYFP